MAKERVLWIEDGAKQDVPFWASPVRWDGKYDLVIATDVTMATNHLSGQTFGIVIFDIRLPAGGGEEWVKIYKQAGSNKASARLGLELLRCIFLPQDCPFHFGSKPGWLIADRVGVLTIESWSDLEGDLTRMGIVRNAYQQKYADAPVTILLELIKRIHKQIKK